MSYEGIVRQYLHDLQETVDAAAATGEATPELSYRPVLDRFLRTISRLYSPNVDVIYEPKLLGRAGRPDWRLYNTENFGLYGFIEAKALDPRRPINVELHMGQINKYLSIGQRVILTDGLEFIFFNPNGVVAPIRCCLVEKPISWPVRRSTRVDCLLDGQLREFFHESGYRQCSEEELIGEIAVRATRLSECVLTLSLAPLMSGISEEENETIGVLHQLKEIFKLHHDPVLEDPKVFADFVAQVLFFGLLYAHRIIATGTGTPRDRYAAIRRFWADAVYSNYTDRLVPFKALVAMLESELSAEQASESQLRCWYDDTCRLLAHVQLQGRQREIPDYHTLYEHFLEKFDPETRFEFGAFYTPHELAGFMVGAARAVIETRFGGRHLYEAGNKIIDPCCGTGTFIEQLVRHSTNQPAVHLVGFEILPAPYALAHYRIAMLNVADTPRHRIEVFLTNTLSDELTNENFDHPNNVLSDELQKARDRSSPPIVLVIGNPPSSDSFGLHSTGANFSAIDELLMDFRPAPEQRRGRQNTQKQIGNDFMKFLRWSSDKVLSSEMGVLSLILPSTFASHPTYRYAREWLARNFSEFWVLDIDRDLRTGVRSSSLFNTLQGRMLLLATHAGTAPNLQDARLHYTSIADRTRNQKKSFLSEIRTTENYMELFGQYDLCGEENAFRPTMNNYNHELYNRFWAIHTESEPQADERHVFSRHCSGMKLAPTAIFVHPKKPLLKRRSQELGNQANSYTSLKAQWFSGQSKPPARAKLTPEVRSRLLTAASGDENYYSYSFRPFVPMHLLLDVELLRVLGSLGGGGTRFRPEVVSAYSNDQTIGIAVAPSRIDIGDSLHRFATFCWDLPDNDLCSRGNAHVFCNQFPENKPQRTLEWDPTPRENISALLLTGIREILPDITSNDIVFYTYAVLCSSVLLETFAAAYFTAAAAENIPRVPVVRDAAVFQLLKEKGRELAELENPRAAPEVLPWLQSQEGAFQTAFNLDKFSIDEEEGEILLRAEGRAPKVRLTNIPPELLKMTVSGYEVVRCWLKFNSYIYTRTSFKREDFQKLLQLLSALSGQAAVIEEIDTVMERIISGDVELL